MRDMLKRMRSVALLTLGFVGCAPPCPPPATSDAVVPIAPTTASCPDVVEQDVAPVVVQTPQASFAGYDGRWYFVEPGDDEVELVMEIHGNRGTLRKVGAEQSRPIGIELQTNGMALVEVTDADGDVERAFLVPRGPNSLTAFELGDDEAIVGRREGPLPTWFEGEWVLASLKGRAPFTLSVDGERGRMTRKGDTHEISIRGIRQEGAMTELVVRVQDPGQREEMAWLRFHDVEPGVYLVFEGHQEDFVVMHRPGSEPKWFTRASRKGPPPLPPGMVPAPYAPIPPPPTPVKPPAPTP